MLESLLTPVLMICKTILPLVTPLVKVTILELAQPTSNNVPLGSKISPLTVASLPLMIEKLGMLYIASLNVRKAPLKDIERTTPCTILSANLNYTQLTAVCAHHLTVLAV